jgi:hypothetical protein
MSRPLKAFLGGAALAVVYVTTTTLVGWHGWMIAAFGAGIGFTFSLIATPLVLGPGTPLRKSEVGVKEIEISEAQLFLPIPGIASQGHGRFEWPRRQHERRLEWPSSGGARVHN